jgi:hypothetical protein
MCGFIRISGFITSRMSTVFVVADAVHFHQQVLRAEVIKPFLLNGGINAVPFAFIKSRS